MPRPPIRVPAIPDVTVIAHYVVCTLCLRSYRLNFSIQREALMLEKQLLKVLSGRVFALRPFHVSLCFTLSGQSDLGLVVLYTMLPTVSPQGPQPSSLRSPASPRGDDQVLIYIYCSHPSGVSPRVNIFSRGRGSPDYSPRGPRPGHPLRNRP
ncbi:hypothetical protein NDU88_006855 [Pleurodeles waltl]|uniref:Uncharacterized protein n=1 Tax=Pleurodeles waltl TaxID=8319 RepID=A0AAV7LY49_PLEWA|nr:hypothetical protein NDU88_006855 [Pleurodeles waltl]